MSTTLEQKRYKLEEELKELQKIFVEKFPEVNDSVLRSLRYEPDLGKYKQYMSNREEILSIANRIGDIQATITYYNKIANKRFRFESGVGDMSNTSSVSNVTTMQTLTDMAAESDTTITTSVPEVMKASDSTSNDMFLKRPVLVYSTETTNVELSMVDVWDAFTMDPSVRARLRNWAYSRGKLGIRIVTTGSPFHIGRLHISYQPYHRLNTTLVAYADNYDALDPNFKACVLNYLSQSKYYKCVNINNNVPVTFVVPFHSHKTKHKNFNDSDAILDDTTPIKDYEHFGGLYFTTHKPIISSSDTLDPITIRIYCWMEDVELTTATASKLIIFESDEREVGPVEKISSGVAAASAALQDLPVIGTAARVSNILATGVSKVASILGWSYPIIHQNQEIVRPQPFTNGANLIGASTAPRITLDPKQEILISTDFAGTNEDELKITYISSILSYFHTVTWGVAEPPSTVMMTSIVTPETYCRSLSKSLYQPTACAFATMPFMYWRGTLKYTFDILCSKYQRGKLVIKYEPNSYQYDLNVSDNDTYNKNHIMIVDIQDTQTFSFLVHWNRERAWLSTLDGPANIAYGDDGAMVPTSYDTSNGYFTVSVFNGLTGPNNSPAYINCYISCEDLRVQCPSDSRMVSSRDFVFESAERTVFPDPVNTMSLNDKSDKTYSMASQHYFGEECLSFRAFFKRFTTTESITVTSNPAAAGPYHFSLLFPIIPRILPTIYNAVRNQNQISQLRLAYMCVRGSLRKRIYLHADSNDRDLLRATVRLEAPSTPPSSATGAFNPGTVTSLNNGNVTFVPSTNGGIEIELPWYSLNLFGFSFTNDLGSALAAGYTNSWVSSYRVLYNVIAPLANTARVVEDTAAGEDFNLFYWIGAPPLEDF